MISKKQLFYDISIFYVNFMRSKKYDIIIFIQFFMISAFSYDMFYGIIFYDINFLFNYFTLSFYDIFMISFF